jgi:Protein of unknown function (DUF692)
VAEAAGAECAPAARVPVTRRLEREAGSSELVGLGLRGAHALELLERQPTLTLLEVHTENYLGGGAPRALLERVRRDYAVSLHGVGMSLGSVEPLSAEYLLLTCQYPAASIWDAHHSGSILNDSLVIAAGCQRYVVVRPASAPIVSTTSAADQDFLLALAQGKTLSQALDLSCAASCALADWIAAGVIVEWFLDG